MAYFEENVDKLLLYDRQDYKDWLSGDRNNPMVWSGISYQCTSDYQLKKEDVDVCMLHLTELLRQIIGIFNNDTKWILNHDDKDLDWLPQKATKPLELKRLFADNNQSGEFKGAIILSNKELLLVASDLVNYPVSLFRKYNRVYKNIDINNADLEIIIKISGHMTLDIICKDALLLKEMISKISAPGLLIQPYY